MIAEPDIAARDIPAPDIAARDIAALDITALAIAAPGAPPAASAVRRELCLILAARRDPGRLDPARPRPWAAMAAMAENQRVKPLLHAILRESRLDVPTEIRADLQAHYYQTVAINAWHFQETARILTAFSAAGIPVILLKGAALADDVYHDRGVRPMGDIDLLVPPADAPEAIRLVQGFGYAPDRLDPYPDLATEFECEVMLVRIQPPRSAIEIHWSLLDSPYYQRQLPMAWFWETARPIRLDGHIPARILGPEAQVLHLSAHLMLHHGNGDAPDLRWLHDIAELIHAHAAEIDWQLVLDQAQASDLVIPLQRTLPLLVRDWDIDLPPTFLAELGRLTPSPSEQRVHRWLTAAHPSPAERLWGDLASLSGWRPRLRFAWHNLCPSPAYMRRRYRVAHPIWLPLTYPYRWLRGLAQVFRRPL